MYATDLRIDQKCSKLKENETKYISTDSLNRSDSVLMSQSTSNNKQNKVERSLSVIIREFTWPYRYLSGSLTLNSTFFVRGKKLFHSLQNQFGSWNLKEFLSKKSVVCLKTFEIKWCCVWKRLRNFTLAFFIVFKTFLFEFVCLLRANDVYKGKFKTIDMFCKCKLQSVIYIMQQQQRIRTFCTKNIGRYFFGKNIH